jgi:hypothetical protein
MSAVRLVLCCFWWWDVMYGGGAYVWPPCVWRSMVVLRCFRCYDVCVLHPPCCSFGSSWAMRFLPWWVGENFAALMMP